MLTGDRHANARSVVDEVGTKLDSTEPCSDPRRPVRRGQLRCRSRGLATRRQARKGEAGIAVQQVVGIGGRRTRIERVVLLCYMTCKIRSVRFWHR